MHILTKKILVTGGAGFIGSHTCLLLLEKGYEIIVLDSFVNSDKKSIARVIELNRKKFQNAGFIKLICGDIRDEKVLDKIFAESELDKPIEAVIHFAGLKAVKESVMNPLIYWDVNVNGSIKLFSVMKKFNCRTIVFSSSATIYGISDDKPISETATINPTNPYGNTKASIELLLNNIFKSDSKSWRIANLRYFNPIGAHQSGLIGESPVGIPNNLFPYITQVASSKIARLNIFGNNWPTIDGTGVRDYIHVMDLAEGHIAALDFLLGSKAQIINLNLGTGKGTSVLELIKCFEAVNNIKIPYNIVARREGDIGTVIADNSLALSSLNWSPKRSLEEMCLDGWKWQKLNPKGY